MPVLYLDVLMAVNLLIDFLLLSVTARLLRLPGKKGKASGRGRLLARFPAV